MLTNSANKTSGFILLGNLGMDHFKYFILQYFHCISTFRNSCHYTFSAKVRVHSYLASSTFSAKVRVHSYPKPQFKFRAIVTVCEFPNDTVSLSMLCLAYRSFSRPPQPLRMLSKILEFRTCALGGW
jgi:hypothetical protein